MKLFLNKLKFAKLNTVMKFSIKSFSDNPWPEQNIKKVSGLMKPEIKRRTPHNEHFYGVPASKTKPKDKNDLVDKLSYLNSYQDMQEFFKNSEQYFTGKELSVYLERLHL